jgi:adenylate cyclase
MEAGAVVKRVATTLVIAAIAGSVTFGIFHFFPFLGTAERWTRDFRIANMSPPEPQHPDIVVAAITEETLSSFPYRSPVDRKFLADTVRAVAAKGAKAILIDVLFDQETEEEKDDELREALAELTIPFSISYSDSPTYVTDEQLAYLDDFVKPTWRGLADIEPDKTDGIIRFVPPPRHVKDGTYVPNVAARIAQLLGATIPEKQSIIAWRGEPDSATAPFREFPAHAVRVLPEAWFKDKIVLIGANLSLTDRYRTPFSIGRDVGDNRMAGIVIQAHILAQMLEGRVAPEERAFLPHVFTLALLALIGAALGSTGVPISARLGGATLAVVLLWAAGWYLFKADHPLVPLVEAMTGGRNVLVPLIEPIVALGMALWLSDAWSGREERQQKKFIQGVFSKYVSADLLNEIVKDPKKLDLSASRRPMSLIFTDVQGFTTLSEKLEAAHLADVLNRCSTRPASSPTTPSWR